MTAVIEVRQLQKRYGDHEAVRDVSFTVERGEIFGIIGRNGAGKTTTVECIEGLRRPDAGSVTVLGRDPRDPDVRQRLGVQLQESQLPDRIRVDEAMGLFASFYERPAAPGPLLERLGLAGHGGRTYKKLSGGQKQRLSIALSLVGSPEVAVLDELTTGLDPQARHDTWRLIADVRDSGVTVLLVTHFMDEAERLCDRIAVIDRGRTVAVDTPQGLIRRVPGGVTVTFRPSGPLDAQALAGVPGVTATSVEDGMWTVQGRGNLAHEVSTALAALHVVPLALNIVQADLESAFVELTCAP
ncbi:ABC transporter ATP-binding protein [Dactylosporangium vinaceum]|uniref:ABC transporter ATP-binding protein n=1 Tax=Dactylosporangium vinaceum TaxID=53362 RepID=A0ABV5MHB0_9ACTN|nr:ABC transporter ATP-binding protein [Dactylosporangium vinaceum]UAB94844.1 ABC transporter ATP-binding protein [Dactylosporangium vinaceum]